jgi:hypothetical protein
MPFIQCDKVWFTYHAKFMLWLTETYEEVSISFGIDLQYEISLNLVKWFKQSDK